MRLRYLILVLLLVPLFAATAGAIYMEGQAPQVDDGNAYLLAASTGMASAPTPTLYDEGPVKQYLSGDVNDYVLEPGDIPDVMYALDSNDVVPIYATVPATGGGTGAVDLGGIELAGNSASHFTVPSLPAYWNDLGDRKMKSNVPDLFSFWMFK